jgi:hypothetical protein
MCKESDELIGLIDEMAGAAASVAQGPQNYECFMKARTELINKITAIRIHTDMVTRSIEDLHELI